MRFHLADSTQLIGSYDLQINGDYAAPITLEWAGSKEITLRDQAAYFSIGNLDL
jgi:hypothetical protein